MVTVVPPSTARVTAHDPASHASQSLRDILVTALSDGGDAAVRVSECEEVLRGLGVKAPADWAQIEWSPPLLERAIRALEPVLSLAEIGRVQRALSVGASLAPLQIAQAPAGAGQSSSGSEGPLEGGCAHGWPLLRVWCHYSFRNLQAILSLDMMAPTSYNFSTLVAQADAKEGADLRGAIFCGSEVLIICNTLITSPHRISSHHLRCSSSTTRSC